MRPAELRRLPGACIKRLADFYNEWGARGALSESAKRAIIALITQTGGRAPKGNCARSVCSSLDGDSQDLRQWSLTLHGGAHEGAATMAFRIAASIELAQWPGDSTMVAFP